MDVIGYADRLVVAPGETIRFHVSCESPRYEARLVRLVHGDESPAGPGYREDELDSALDGEYPGRVQGFPSGSYVRVEDAPALHPRRSFAVEAWVWPTTPGSRRQGLVTKGDVGLFLGEAGDLELQV